MPRSSSRPTRAQLLEENAALRAQIAHLENAAPAREDAYRVLFENAPVAISRSAPDGTLLEVNPAFAQLFGYATPQAFLAAGLTGAQLYADPGTRARLFAAVRDRADILRAEVQYRRPDGTEFPGQVTVRAVRDAAGRIAHLEGFIEDITDRWQAEEALRASEAALRALFDAAGDALFLLAVDETVRAVNHSGAAWLGRPPVAIIGQPFTRLLTAEARAHFQPYLAQALAGRAARFESGSAEQWYDHSLCPVLDGSGAVTGVAILAHDLTERRRIEAELRRSEQIHRSFIEHSSDGCILTDEHGRVQEWNPASERLTGLPREAVLGQPSWEVQARLMPAAFQSPASIASLRTAMQDVLRTGQAPFLGQALERPFQRADGEARFVRQMAFAIPTAAGYWLGSTTSDITERQRAEAALRESETQYRLLFDHLHEGFALHAVITNAEGQVVDFRILDANQAYERHTGRRPAEVIGRTMLELYPATEPAMIARYGAVAVDGEPRTWEFFSEAYQRYLRVHAFSPQPGYFATTFEDITASQLAEARLRRFWDLPLIGMAITSPDRRILEINQKGAEMLGYTPAELAGASWVDLSHPDDVAENTRLLAQTLAGITDEYQMDKRFFRKDGALLYAHVAARCVRRADGVVDHLALIVEDITDRQRADAQLQASEERYRQLVENSPDLVYEYAPQSGGVFYSARTAAVLGYPLETLYANPSLWHDSIHPEDLPRVDANVEAFTQGRPFEVEYRIRDARGEWHWFLDRSIGARTSTAGLIVRGLATDITDRKRLEAELQTERDFALSIMNAMGQGLTVTDDQMRFEYINPAYAAFTGYQPQDLLGQTPLAVTVAADQAGLERSWAERQAGKTTTYESRLRHADGRVVEVLITGSPRWRDGRVQGTIAVITDLTERQQAERAVREERVRLRALIAASRDGLALIGTDRQVYVVNEPALRYLNLPGQPADWEGRALTDALRMMLDQAMPPEVFADARRIERGAEQPAEGEWTLAARTLHWLSQPVRAGDQWLGWLIVLRDVTAERQVERLRDDLTRTMVHDLRNPLNSVRSALQLFTFEEGERLSAGQQEIVDLALQGTESLLDLVAAILDVSRLESGQMPLQREPISLRELVTQLLRQQAPLALARRLTITAELAPDLPAIYADAGLLRRVLQNLVGNALKFTPAGGQVRLTAKAPAGERQVWMAVSDTGPGMAPEVWDRLFQKFVTGRVPGHGSGLGLAFCRQAVEVQGGRIWAERAPAEGGATVTFTMPICEFLAADH
ncbi:MAG: PAS domain S-box protein [Anaerolineales bacterium]|nr:PAS domain S-box protein [Anaerolineales bacterium]